MCNTSQICAIWPNAYLLCEICPYYTWRLVNCLHACWSGFCTLIPSRAKCVDFRPVWLIKRWNETFSRISHKCSIFFPKFAKCVLQVIIVLKKWPNLGIWLMGTISKRLAQLQPFGELANDLLSADVQHSSDLCSLTKCLLFVRDMPSLHMKILETAYMLADMEITRWSPQGPDVWSSGLFGLESTEMSHFRGFRGFPLEQYITHLWALLVGSQVRRASCGIPDRRLWRWQILRLSER